jgi:multidrug efflux pump subunit AcrA (membrane-fusion protein)
MKRWIYALIPVLVLGSLIGWRIVQKRTGDADQARSREMRKNAPIRVSTAPVVVRDIVHTFADTGTVESPQNVKIAPKVSGRIEYLALHEGDRVRQGQVLVRIDPSQVEALVHQQMAALAEAQYRLAQAQITQNSTNVGVSAQVRQQKAGVSSAKADLNQVTLNYKAQVAAANAGVTDAQNRIDNAKASIKSAQANLDNATAKYNRIYDLYK